MKTFFKIVIGVVAALIVIMLLMGKKYHFETSAVIKAPADKVWQNMSSMKAFNEWNPFMELDPNVKVSYSGSSGQVGDQYCWEGNDDAGKGCHVVTALVPDQKLSTKMLFEKPFKSEATSDLVLTPAGNSTKVTWSMDCELDYPMNLMKFFMDSQMEKSYGSGSKKLKLISEE